MCCGPRGILLSAEERYPRLASYARSIADLREVVRGLRGKILPDGTLADDASVALGRLRRDAERQRRLIEESLARFLRAAPCFDCVDDPRRGMAAFTDRRETALAASSVSLSFLDRSASEPRVTMPTSSLSSSITGSRPICARAMASMA